MRLREETASRRNARRGLWIALVASLFLHVVGMALLLILRPEPQKPAPTPPSPPLEISIVEIPSKEPKPQAENPFADSGKKPSPIAQGPKLETRSSNKGSESDTPA